MNWPRCWEVPGAVFGLPILYLREDTMGKLIGGISGFLAGLAVIVAIPGEQGFWSSFFVGFSFWLLGSLAGGANDA